MQYSELFPFVLENLRNQNLFDKNSELDCLIYVRINLIGFDEFLWLLELKVNLMKKGHGFWVMRTADSEISFEFLKIVSYLVYDFETV